MTDPISLLMNEGFLVDPEAVPLIDERKARDIIEFIFKNKLLPDIISPEFVASVTKKGKISSKTTTDVSEEILIKKFYQEIDLKNAPKEFVRHYRTRYSELQNILKARQVLRGQTSISRIKSKDRNENVSIIGYVTNKSITKNKNILLTLEDPTGSTNALINSNKGEIYDIGKDLCLDEVIGIEGATGNNIVFANNVVLPDVPISKEFKKAPYEAYAVFISDIHVGSEAFLQKDFEKFIRWMKGSIGNETQRNIASKIRYLIITGDLVEGVGIYPNQEEELAVKDIKDQYKQIAHYLKELPPFIKIIICAGNHDAVRLAEPQPPIDREIAAPLYELPNIVHVTNPATITIGKTESFPGFDILMYHGGSFIYYADAIESIRFSGGLKRVDLISRYLLKRRHLAPTHGSTLYRVNFSKDPLLIKQIPDIMISGHIHRSTVDSYRNISILNSSCWVRQTKYQEKVGLKPQPGKIPIINLKTRETKVMSFVKE